MKGRRSTVVHQDDIKSLPRLTSANTSRTLTMTNLPSNSKRSWDPWKMYDISQQELRAIRERAQMRQALKAEWQKKVTDPYRSLEGGGHIFDPAVQRFMSMRATQFDHFKITTRTTWYGFIFVVFPVGFFGYLTMKEKEEREAIYRAGKVKYKDRSWYFMY